ncbi:MAG: nucleotidyltransferase domain-containing protein, partial [Myxococcaceae bacterium]|nr:nucleotidyltransferase domain-containing protein [Myxococcaceae bacterium]
VLTPHQLTVATRFLDEQAKAREHLVVSLSGAHAYGFPSPDSDLDLKAVHVEPTRELLGLEPRSRAGELLQVVDGVEVDYSSNEVQGVLRGVVAGNGNYVERLLGNLSLVTSAALGALRPLVSAALSRRVHRHYQGFASQQLREWEAGGFQSAKKLLYVVRTTLTGTHLLCTGQLETDVTRLLGPYALEDVRALVDAKRQGELASLPEALSREWQRRVEALFTRLDAAKDSAVLPAEAKPGAVQALEAWLLELRRARW